MVQIAAEFGGSFRTVHEWLRRFREGDRTALGNGASAPGRALAWFTARGVQVERVMTDNGSCYRSKLFAKTLAPKSHR